MNERCITEYYAIYPGIMWACDKDVMNNEFYNSQIDFGLPSHYSKALVCHIVIFITGVLQLNKYIFH